MLYPYRNAMPAATVPVFFFFVFLGERTWWDRFISFSLLPRAHESRLCVPPSTVLIRLICFWTSVLAKSSAWLFCFS